MAHASTATTRATTTATTATSNLSFLTSTTTREFTSSITTSTKSTGTLNSSSPPQQQEQQQDGKAPLTSFLFPTYQSTVTSPSAFVLFDKNKNQHDNQIVKNISTSSTHIMNQHEEMNNHHHRKGEQQKQEQYQDTPTTSPSLSSASTAHSSLPLTSSREEHDFVDAHDEGRFSRRRLRRRRRHHPCCGAPCSSSSSFMTRTSWNHFAEDYCTRPRLLFATTFLWLTVTGGRFLAPFLEHACHLNARDIGTVLSAQQFVLTLASALAGRVADWAEGIYPGMGRLLVVASGVGLASASMSLHGVSRLLVTSADDSALSSSTVLFFRSVAWHATVQGLQGLGVSMVFPVLDGLTVDFLMYHDHHHHHDDSSGAHGKEAYGRERLHGPLWWAVANLALSPLLDQWGFDVCFPLSWICAVVVWMSIFVYHRNNQNNLHRSLVALSLQVEAEPENTRNAVQLTRQDTHDALNISSDPLSMTDETGNDFPETTLIRRDNSNVTPTTSLDDSDDFNQHAVAAVTTIPTPDSDISLSMWQLLRLLFSSVAGVGFLVCIFCLSSGQSVVDNLIFLYFEALGNAWVVMGVTVVIKIAAEVPMFYFGPTLLQNYGAAKVLLLGCACYWIRVVIYPYLPYGNVWYVLALEPLHGITYGAAQLSMVDFVASCMPPGYEASGQGLVYLVKDGGSVLGVWLGGWAQTAIDSSYMFHLSATIVACGAMTLMASQCCWGHRRGLHVDQSLVPESYNEFHDTGARYDDGTFESDVAPEQGWEKSPNHLKQNVIIPKNQIDGPSGDGDEKNIV